MTDYPILVERWDKAHPSDDAVCTRCGHTFKWDPADGDPDDLCSTHGNPTVAGDCGGPIVMKYDEGVRCKGCGKLDYSFMLGGCCSRKCQLQAEYAATLKARA